MTNASTETTESARDGTGLRADYEGNVIPVKTLSETYGLSYRSIYNRAHVEGWKLRQPRRVDKNDLIERMLRLIEDQMQTLEIEMVDNPSGNEAAVLSRLATTLDKLISLKAAEQASHPKRRGSKAMEEIRRKVADRLAELNGR